MADSEQISYSRGAGAGYWNERRIPSSSMRVGCSMFEPLFLTKEKQNSFFERRMGISTLIGLKATALFLLFLFFKNLQLPFISIPILYYSLISYLVSLASHPSVNLPLILGKTSDGTFPLWPTLIFGPFLFFIRFFVFLRRMISGDRLFTEISEGLFVGGWPSSLEQLPPGDLAVIDCTCELSRSSAFSNHSYLCIATWDTRAPQPFQIELAVRWASKKRALKKSVYIHCAFGHGRSVCVMCALLVSLGLAEDWKTAEKLIKEKRPAISMNDLHRRSLNEWSKNRITAQRRPSE